MKRTPQQMIDALSQLFLNCEDLETDEEIDAALREFGYDPDELGRKFKVLADKALAEQAAKLAQANPTLKRLDTAAKIGYAIRDAREGVNG